MQLAFMNLFYPQVHVFVWIRSFFISSSMVYLTALPGRSGQPLGRLFKAANSF